jgi:predicted aspartyl protease
VAVIPFAWTPGQIEVAVRVNGLPATFLLDTGAEYSVVSSKLAAQLGLPLERSGARDFADNVTIEMNDLVVRHPRVMVMPFDGYNARGRAIEGLVGYDLFARFVVRIGFDDKTLTVWEPSAFEPPRSAAIVPIEFAGRLPVMRAVLKLAGGRSLTARLMVDTGASQAVILRYPFAREHELFDLGGGASTANSLASGVRKLTAIPVEQVTMSQWTFERPAVQAYAEPVGSGGYTESDGLIGNALLSKFAMYVDYPRRRLLFEPSGR